MGLDDAGGRRWELRKQRLNQQTQRSFNFCPFWTQSLPADRSCYLFLRQYSSHNLQVKALAHYDQIGDFSQKTKRQKKSSNSSFLSERSPTTPVNVTRLESCTSIWTGELQAIFANPMPLFENEPFLGNAICIFRFFVDLQRAKRRKKKRGKMHMSINHSSPALGDDKPGSGFHGC